MNALAAGLVSGSVVATVMLTVSTLVGIAAIGLTPGLAISLSCIFAALAGGLLQQVFFNPHVLGARLSYPVRVALFGVVYLAVLVGCALLGGWVPRENAAAWAMFVVLYLVILAVLTAVFSLWYRRQAAAYDERLERYRAGRER